MGLLRVWYYVYPRKAGIQVFFFFNIFLVGHICFALDGRGFSLSLFDLYF